MCYGLGYTSKEKDGTKDICTVCEGSGKMYSQAHQHLMEEKRRKELAKEEEATKLELTEEEHS